MINVIKLKYYIENFYGYGNWDSPYYFIGMEEGGGSDYNLVNEKIENYYYFGVDRGNNFFIKEKLIDNYGFQIFMMPEALREIQFFRLNPLPNLQSTWKPSIKMLMTYNDLTVNDDEMRLFQRLHFGSNQTPYKHALIDLLPLPSPGLKDWNYRQWVDNANGIFLDTRDNYRNNYIGLRIKHICKKISDNKPKLVVFYGTGYINYYNQIINCINNSLNFIDLEINTPNDTGRAKYSIQKWDNSSTVFIICSHPTSTGLTNEFWINLIQQIGNIM